MNASHASPAGSSRAAVNIFRRRVRRWAKVWSGCQAAIVAQTLPATRDREARAPDDPEQPTAKYSVSQGAVDELKAQQRRAEVQRFRARLAEMNARAREEAMDRPPPATGAGISSRARTRTTWLAARLT